MATLKMHEWEGWQTFRKDRGTPPWIKVYRSLLSSSKWAALTDAEKGQLVSIWMVAADNNGEITADPRVIMKICQLDTIPSIQKFIDLRLMATTCQPDGNQVVTVSAEPHVNLTHQSRVEESRVEEKKTMGENPPVSVPSKENLFDIFWKEYPKKKKRGDAEKAWKAAKITPGFFPELLGAIKKQKQSPDWLKDGGQFIPYPATWLRAKGWADETEVDIGESKWM